MTAPPKINRTTTLLALAALAVIAAGCGKTAVRKDADTVQTAANVIRGTFTDSRDGKTYRTVKIGRQTWMAENLNFETEKSSCYDNADSSCTKYGRMYSWEDALEACPAGWRVPTDEDWDSLALAVGGQRVKNGSGGYDWKFVGKKLKSTTGWDDWKDGEGKLVSGNGTDEFGFSALPGGGRSDDSFYGAGDFGYWWSATENHALSAWGRVMATDIDYWRDIGYKSLSYSLRCLQDSADLR